MKMLDKLYDRLPAWLKVVIGVASLVGFIYLSLKDGFGKTLLKLLLAP